MGLEVGLKCVLYPAIRKKVLEVKFIKNTTLLRVRELKSLISEIISPTFTSLWYALNIFRIKITQNLILINECIKVWTIKISYPI